jgi:hypothetical protein
MPSQGVVDWQQPFVELEGHGVECAAVLERVETSLGLQKLLLPRGLRKVVYLFLGDAVEEDEAGGVRLETGWVGQRHIPDMRCSGPAGRQAKRSVLT